MSSDGSTGVDAPPAGPSTGDGGVAGAPGAAAPRSGPVAGTGNFADYQNEVYARGMLEGTRPTITTVLADLPAVAAAALHPVPSAAVFGGAGSGTTAQANRQALDAWRVLPRHLSGSARRDYACDVLGTAMIAPVLLGPVGVQTLAHPEGELASSRAAAAVGLTYVHSTQASHSFEQVAEANGSGSRWFQLYWPSDDDLCLSFLRRARDSGYTALVLTLDTDTVLGWRPRDLDHGYLPFLEGVGVANYFTDPVFTAALARPVDEDPVAAALAYVAVYSRPALAWTDLAFLRRAWDGPIVLKGILSVEDARLAMRYGMDGIVVSNHGGRQVDGEVATADVLPGIVEAVGNRLTVLFDSGVRTGVDIVRALALGADAVLVARPFLAGLALGGEAGVEHVLRSLLAEFDITVALSGRASHTELDGSVLVRQG